MATTVAAEIDPALGSAREASLLQLCDALRDSTRVEDALWSKLAAKFTPEALLEPLLLNGYYRTISVLTNTLEMPLEAYAARFPAADSGA